ncbi:calcium-activated chloride channel-domain-containing protein [Zychaea mexicana]|uniref:calcium-activated chloride channel-domain-containing protein n=1 Tax=Zychaea mexicana TaxID=64656 RepID=UPI0022FE768A|nr:calcium-activated chloride channel-domain-containing protein [Zychaea mexicana]KAI9485131.1 calcium-activated chloride channel-domain-containing protein [Zychaea mexicana]
MEQNAPEQHAIQPGSGEFAHLFPPVALSERNATKESSSNSTTTTKAPSRFAAGGVDYVIVFKFPTRGQEREKLQSNAQEQLDILTTKLSRVGLRYQVQPGRTQDTLLILIACPTHVLEEELKRERIRDFLLGIRVSEFDNEKEETKDMFAANVHELTEAERLRVVYEMLTEPETEGGANISPEVDLFVDGIIPLHNDEFNKEWIHTWSKKSLIDDQDLTNIRNHFGEKIAFYFAFVQNYLLWLGTPTVIGVLITVAGAKSLSIWYSLAMLIWSVVYIEMWKRREQALALQWGVRNCSKHEKRRLEFKGDRLVKDEVTGEQEPYCPAWKIFVRRAMSFPGVALGAFLLSIIVACVIVLQLFLHEYYTGPFRQVLHYTPTIGYVLLIPTMSGIYGSWVKILNNWEMHKTESSWEYHYTQKIFVANFLVAYLSLLNISHSHTKVDFNRLRGQLIYFIVTGQLIGFATEMVLPYAMGRILPKVKNMTSKEDKDDKNNGVEQSGKGDLQAKFMKKVYHEVDLPEYNIYTDFVEMVIQFGYVSMFSTVWPLTALCCMVNNWIELRGDAVKICKYTRRPVPLRSEGVGPWIGNMETLTWLSSVTMASFAYLFHPSTNIHSPYTPVFTILAVLLSEHLYVIIRLVVRSTLNALPSWSDTMIRKGEFKMKKVWLQRLMGSAVGQQQQQKRATIGDEELVFDDNDLSAKSVWDSSSSSSMDAAQFIRNAFKKE